MRKKRSRDTKVEKTREYKESEGTDYKSWFASDKKGSEFFNKFGKVFIKDSNGPEC